MTTLKAWSYSVYSVEKKCPFSLKCRVDKVKPFATTQAMERGIMVHAKAENVVNGTIKGIPKELKNFSGEFKNLARMYKRKDVVVLCEKDIAVTKNFKKKSAGDDWDNVWCRGKGDLIIIEDEDGAIVDHKTGGIYEEDHEEQGELYSVQASVHFPEVKFWHVEMWYLDKNDSRQWSYSIRDINKLKKKWVQKGNNLMNRKKFPMTPGQHCNWCAYSRSKGGPCKNG